MLMVDGVLYMWARNAEQLATRLVCRPRRHVDLERLEVHDKFRLSDVSELRKRLRRARDDYVYVYSQDSDSAYKPADRMVLARVPKTASELRGAYEFFQQAGTSGQPHWTDDIRQRGAVFSHPGSCYRAESRTTLPLKRYVWCQILPPANSKGPRFEGGFGVYDAPEPWGPWTTAFFTKRWDVGPGETSSFPTKWISRDGRTMHLVFSGDDHFSVRRATLEIAQSPNRPTDGR